MADRRGLTLILLLSTSALSQAQRPSAPEFEVAAIRPSSPASSSGGVRLDGAQLHMAGFPFREYVARAYRVRMSQVIGPDWMSSTRFDIDAKLPQGATADQISEMLQALLADRFALKQHREQKEMPMYALVLGKPPLKLKESPRDRGDAEADARNEALVNVTVAVGAAGTAVDLGHGSSYMLGTGGRFDGKRFTAEMLASTLERYCDRPVVNMTGLRGTYDVVFEVTPEESQVIGIRAAVNAGVRLPPQVTSVLDTGGNPLVTAVEQLGLKLDARKAPVEVLVVEDARRTPTGN
jgi:uncharacterized protein (TIGR03435 family)